MPMSVIFLCYPLVSVFFCYPLASVFFLSVGVGVVALASAHF